LRRIGKLAQADELADPLPPVPRQLGRAAGDKAVPQIAFTEQLIERGRCLIDQGQDQYPKLDRNEAMPVEGRNHVRQEGAEWHTRSMNSTIQPASRTPYWSILCGGSRLNHECAPRSNEE